MSVKVCRDKDIECGTTPKLWCSRCPNWSSESGRNTLLDRIAALEAENVEPTPEMCRALFCNLARADDEAYVIKAVMAAAPKEQS